MNLSDLSLNMKTTAEAKKKERERWGDITWSPIGRLSQHILAIYRSRKLQSLEH